MRRSTGGRRRQRRPRGTRQTSWRNSTPVLVAKAIANSIPESNASTWQTALSESSPARCFQVDREIIRAAHAWGRGLSALYESRVIRPQSLNTARLYKLIHHLSDGAKASPQRASLRSFRPTKNVQMVVRIDVRMIPALDPATNRDPTTETMPRMPPVIPIQAIPCPKTPLLMTTPTTRMPRASERLL